MPQLRQDRFTKEWVFVATEYVKHPQDLIVKRAEKRLAAFDPYCPFCPGNETQTPPEVLRVSSPSKCEWGVRVVPNKFTAVREAGMNYYHWYLNIVPCLTPQPSLEMRPGMFINTVLPEKAAEFLREVHAEQAIPA